MHPAEGKKEGKHIVNLFTRHYSSNQGREAERILFYLKENGLPLRGTRNAKIREQKSLPTAGPGNSSAPVRHFYLAKTIENLSIMAK
jgi:hypothetical protein